MDAMSLSTAVCWQEHLLLFTRTAVHSGPRDVAQRLTMAANHVTRKCLRAAERHSGV